MASKRRSEVLAHISQTAPLGATNFIKVHNQLLLSCFITSVSLTTCLQAGRAKLFSNCMFLNPKPLAISRTPFLVKKSPKIVSQILKKSLSL